MANLWQASKPDPGYNTHARHRECTEGLGETWVKIATDYKTTVSDTRGLEVQGRYVTLNRDTRKGTF